MAKADQAYARPWGVHQLCPNRPANKNEPEPKQLDENMWTVILLMKIQVTETHAQSCTLTMNSKTFGYFGVLLFSEALSATPLST